MEYRRSAETLQSLHEITRYQTRCTYTFGQERQGASELNGGIWS